MLTRSRAKESSRPQQIWSRDLRTGLLSCRPGHPAPQSRPPSAFETVLKITMLGTVMGQDGGVCQ
jgi:hypothetical protein